jgi:imidazolonepropionase-like amidohydrolase
VWKHRGGGIALGFEADLLFVQGDPTTDIGDMVRVRGVVLGGSRQQRIATSTWLTTLATG